MHLIYFSQIDPMTSQGYVWKMIKITLILPWSGLCKEINECIYKNIVIQPFYVLDNVKVKLI